MNEIERAIEGKGMSETKQYDPCEHCESAVKHNSYAEILCKYYHAEYERDFGAFERDEKIKYLEAENTAARTKLENALRLLKKSHKRLGDAKRENTRLKAELEAARTVKLGFGKVIIGGCTIENGAALIFGKADTPQRITTDCIDADKNCVADLNPYVVIEFYNINALEVLQTQLQKLHDVYAGQRFDAGDGGAQEGSEHE